jgi:AcrR family transcriptional regulator
MSIPLKNKPRWERRKDARPQELLTAALDHFVEHGYAATRLDNVAATAGVSKGTLYLYYTSKEELFKAVVRENVVPIIGEAEGLIEGYEGSTVVLFRQLMLGWWERIGSTRLAGICKLMIAESGNFPDLAAFYHEEVILRGDAIIARMLERGIERGEFRRVDAQRMTDVIVAPMLMLMMWKHSFGARDAQAIDPAVYLDNFIDLCLNGLVPASSGGKSA